MLNPTTLILILLTGLSLVASAVAIRGINGNTTHRLQNRLLGLCAIGCTALFIYRA